MLIYYYFVITYIHVLLYIIYGRIIFIKSIHALYLRVIIIGIVFLNNCKL